MTFCTAIVACGLFPLAQLPPLTHVDTWTQGLEHPSRLAVSPSEVLVADPQVGTITRFDLAGNFLGTWSEPAGPLGVAVHPDGRIFVARRQDAQVAVYDGSFAFQHFISAAPFGFVRPTDLTVDPSSGVLYVVDSGADRLYGFDASETLVLVIGARGSGFGQFKNPSAVAVDGANGRIFVADQDNFRVQVFSLAGIFLRSFGYRIKYLPGGVSEGWLPRTTGLSVDAAGNVYVLDALMGTLRIFDSDGGELGKVVEYGTTAGQLQRPGDVALDAAGRVYVTNSGPGSVEVYQAPLSGLLEAAPARHPLGSNASPETLEQRIISLVGSAWDRFRGGAGSDPFGPRTPPGWDPPHMLDDLNCDRCHSIDGQPEGHLGTRDGQTNLCLSCHMGAGQAAAALIRPTTNIGMSHAWAVPAVNPVFGSVGPAPGGPLEPYLSNGDIKCATCHNQHNHDAAAPYLRAPADAMCQECHANHTIHTPAGSWQPTCTECHVAHDPDDRNLSLVAATVRNLTLGVDKAVVFTARTGPNSFDDGDPAANDGICQVCHTATTYHTHDGSG
ncbi:MAG: hypothetical protein ACE5E1_05460, partial [Phycisphaerae bacterium]